MAEERNQAEAREHLVNARESGARAERDRAAANEELAKAQRERASELDPRLDDGGSTSGPINR